MMEWLFLLLPVAAASGWWAARRSTGGPPSGKAPDPAYFRGLNYLLDEQPDKAIDVFIKLAEVDSETVETHLALGSLFRRRGEADRAIRIHQSLVARPDLDKQQRAYALYELGQDYMRAGLFDRAESLFAELVEMKLHRRRALEGLREIYQQEKDWRRCLEVAEQLESLTGVSMRTEIAQYHCELAEEALKAADVPAAQGHLAEAQAVDAQCARAALIQARMAMEQGEPAQAAALYRRLAGQCPRYLPEILPGLLDALSRSGCNGPLEELRGLNRDHPSPSLMLALADALRESQGPDAAVDLLVDYVSSHADLAGLERLLEIEQERLPVGNPRAEAVHGAVLGVVRHLRARQPEYQCDHCGFVARRLHWQCPSCKHWGSIQPVQPPPIAGAAHDAGARRTA
jgi:lipopolysaccharide biosynthesis regulator YciM